ncbi:MAG: hypothetical protein AYK23_00840 [Candidatus Proteinoplasmatales archaeon SG8-5]|nr:MAG: hypothetical protein AYK23_00840 [Candidatus Proteinoplasmatales archaeon SG8-5]
MQPRLGDKEHNIRIAEKVLASTDADVLIFPEMFLTGYTLADRIHELAESLDDKSVRRLDALAKESGRWMVVGIPEKDPVRTGLIFNSAVVLSPEDEPEAYRKMVLANFGPFEEDLYYTRGDALPLFETPVGTMGITICFDIFFPEIAKAYALGGADIIVNISASPSVTREYFEKITVARAIENTAFVAFANLIGTERHMTFWGGDCLIGPRGNLKAGGKAFEEGIVNAEVDLSELAVARQFRPTIRETRYEIMDILAQYGEEEESEEFTPAGSEDDDGPQ